VAKIGRQHGKPLFDLLAGAVPIEQRLDRETMSEIMDARSIALTWLSDPDLP